MEEEKFVEEQIENIDITEAEEIVVPVVDESIILATQDDIVATNIKEEEIFNVTISEDVGPHALKIVSDHSFGLPRQHSIGAIEGLREELDEIERLKTVYSDGKNQANYYMWEDENPNQENRDGYFVSIHRNDNKIRICKSDEDEFGVTVSSAGFIGNQNDKIPRDSNYGLVVHSGLVGVRCGTDVVQGDYVASDDYGVAQKTDGTYGYLVTAISKINGVDHAIISLTMPTTQMQKFSEITQDVAERMDSAETNISTAISVANAAYNKAQVAQDWVQGNVENIAGDVVIIGGKVDNIIADIEDLDIKVVDATTEALKAQSEASALRTESNEANNATNSHISSLINALNPNKTWTDPENMDMWNDYFADYIKDGNIPTTSQIKALDGGLTHAKSMMSQNALDIEHIVTSIDNYSVGEWSQAYGLNLAEAWNILKVGMIYIPTPEIHKEKYEYKIIDSWGDDEEEIKKRDTNTVYMTTDDGSYWRYLPVAGDGNLTYEWTRLSLEYEENGETKDYVIKDEYEFTRGYYYTWNGFYWVESESPYVYFSSKYVNPSQECQYWYVDSHENLDHEGTFYKARGLYKWDQNKSEWVEVNILAGNITNRATSSLIQTATEIAANVTNARGWLAHMGVKITEDGSFVDQVASVVTPLLVGEDKHKVTLEKQYIFDEEPTDSIIGVEGQYYAVGTEKPYDVYIYQDGIWKKKPLLYYDDAYIMKINTSSILLSANEDEAIVSVNGPTIFTTDENGGVTGINGSCITTGTIAANDGTVKIDLGVGTACVSGRITATSGYIGDEDNGFAIEKHYTVRTHIITDENGLIAGIYCFEHEGQYYEFTTTQALNYEDIIEMKFIDNVGYVSYGEVSNQVVKPTKNHSETSISLSSSVNNDAGYYYLANNQLSLAGNKAGDEGIYISPQGIGLGNGKFSVDKNGTTQIVATFDDYGNPSTYSIFDSDGYKRYIDGERVQTYSMLWFGPCEIKNTRLPGYDQVKNIIIYLPGQYYYQWAIKYNKATAEQKKQMLHTMYQDRTDIDSQIKPYTWRDYKFSQGTFDVSHCSHDEPKIFTYNTSGDNFHNHVYNQTGAVLWATFTCICYKQTGTVTWEIEKLTPQLDYMISTNMEIDGL